MVSRKLQAFRFRFDRERDHCTGCDQSHCGLFDLDPCGLQNHIIGSAVCEVILALRRLLRRRHHHDPADRTIGGVS